MGFSRRLRVQLALLRATPPHPLEDSRRSQTQRSWRLLRRLAFVTYTQEVQARHIFFQLHASIQGARYPARSGVAGNLSR